MLSGTNRVHLKYPSPSLNERYRVKRRRMMSVNLCQNVLVQVSGQKVISVQRFVFSVRKKAYFMTQKTRFLLD